jgi:cell volume regulation protein A
MISVESLLLIFSILILLSIGIARLFDNLGVPTLVIFIVVGMLAGSEGIGGIYFDNARLAQAVGIISLVFILFSGGLETDWAKTKRVVKPAFSLATLGVFLTAVALGIFTAYLLKVPLVFGLLIGSIISSTDAAAVFSILRARKTGLKGEIKPLLELESGSNDPMAVLLTLGCIQILTIPGTNAVDIILLFIFQMGLGSIAGFLFGRLVVIILNRLKFGYDGLYPVIALALTIFAFSLTALLNGSGFLAVYIMGIIIGNSSFVQKRGMVRFFDGFAWLSQLAMFLTLGLLVFPSELVPVLSAGVLIAAFLIFIARPLSVFISLSFSKYSVREKVFISWVGLRGAVPVILAIFPLTAGVEHADLIFNIVFFVVLSSALLQGWSLPFVAKLLKLNVPVSAKTNYPIEFNPAEGADTELIDLIVPYNAQVTGKTLAELSFPADSRIVLIWRSEKSIVPDGSTALEEGDTLLILVNKSNINFVKDIIK